MPALQSNLPSNYIIPSPDPLGTTITIQIWGFRGCNLCGVDLHPIFLPVPKGSLALHQHRHTNKSSPTQGPTFTLIPLNSPLQEVLFKLNGVSSACTVDVFHPVPDALTRRPLWEDNGRDLPGRGVPPEQGKVDDGVEKVLGLHTAVVVV